jgi:hypothetical protein
MNPIPIYLTALLKNGYKLPMQTPLLSPNIPLPRQITPHRQINSKLPMTPHCNSKAC